MRFHDPLLLGLFFLLIPVLLLLRRQTGGEQSFPCADGNQIRQLPVTFRARTAGLLPWLRLPVLALLIIAMARPQALTRETSVKTKAVDLMVALDLSTSMLAEDSLSSGGHKNRLTAAKEVLTDFLRKRPGDRIGLVAFAARPYAAAPLTLDHDWLKGAVDRLQVGDVEDGTAVGDGLLAALNRLRDKAAGSRAVILITDGRSNCGTPPAQAAAAAAALGVRVHTVGIGTIGTAVFPTEDPLGGISYRKVQADLDEATLRLIADTTGGRYFRADDQRGLALVLGEIDRLEKRPVEQKLFFSYRELFTFFVLAGLMLFLAGQLLGLTLLRRVP
jgi:Ca-activated chloride channel family protein